MTQTSRALYAFYSGFGLPAYPERGVPEEAQPPYITYTLVEPDWRAPSTHQARIWTRSESDADAVRKADEILHAVGECLLLKTEGGYIALRPGEPLAQLQPDEDPLLKIVYLNFQINAYTMR